MDMRDDEDVERALSRSETYYRLLTRAMVDIVWTMDLELKTTYVSPSVERVLGFSPEERMRQGIEEQLTPESLELALKALAEELRREGEGADPDRTAVVEVECFRKDGTTIWMENKITGMRDEQGRLVGLYGLARDVTERKRDEAMIRASEEKYRTLFESCMDGIVFVTIDGTIVEANKAYLDMLGYDKHEVLGLKYQELTPSRWHGIEQGIIDSQVMRRGYSNLYEKEYRRKDGTVFPISIRTWIIRDEKNRPAGMWAFVRDISEYKKAAAEKDRLLRELQDALAKVRQLTGIIPICSYCRKIKDSEGHWQKFEKYIQDHTDARFSHDICGECYSQHWPEEKS